MVKFQSDRILSYFRVEWRALLAVTLSAVLVLFYSQCVDGKLGIRDSDHSVGYGRNSPMDEITANLDAGIEASIGETNGSCHFSSRIRGDG